MGSESELRIAQIDFSDENLRPGTTKWVVTCGQVRRALEEMGCFEAIYNRAPPELHDAVFATAEELFDLSLEVKTRPTSDKPSFDYYGQYKTMPLYESLGIDHPTTFEGSQSFTKIMWPNGNERFSEITRESAQAFSKKLAELGEMMLGMVCESYGIENYQEHFTDAMNYLFRYFKYRKPEADETTVGIVPHTDKSMFSIMCQHQVSGLQVRARDGTWIDIEPSPCTFLVISGDVLQAWSNDRIPPCEHQVTLKEKKTRYSAGLFAYMRGMVETPKEMVDENHPLNYKPFDNFGYLRFHTTYEGQKMLSIIKAYCGLSPVN